MAIHLHRVRIAAASDAGRGVRGPGRAFRESTCGGS